MNNDFKYTINNLTQAETRMYMDLLRRFSCNNSFLYTNRYRQNGKTFAINSASFTLQALGYTVLIYGQPQQEYIAHAHIRNINDVLKFDRTSNKIAVLFDYIECEEVRELSKQLTMKGITHTGILYKPEKLTPPIGVLDLYVTP